MKKTITIALFVVIITIFSFGAFKGGFSMAQKIDKKLGFGTKTVSFDMADEIPKGDLLKDENLGIAASAEIQEIISENQLGTSETSEQIGVGETANENKFSFAILGDTQYFNSANPGGSFQSAVKNIKGQNVDLVFALGDIISSCDGDSKCEGKLNQWKSIIGPLFSKTYVMMGNHDRTGKDKADAMYQRFFNFPTNGPAGFSELAYSFDFKNSHFVVLDSDKPKEYIINSTQRDWLEQDLTRNKKENTFVFFHEPAYPLSDKIKESLDVNPKDRNALWDILVRNKVKAVFNGHEHIQSRKNANGVYQFVFGTTDSGLHELPKAGMAEWSLKSQAYGIISIEGKKIKVDTYYVYGKLANSFSF